MRLNAFTIKGKWRDFRKGCRNIIAWWPVIWRDRDFDTYDFFVILAKKLERMKESHAMGIYGGYESVVEDIGRAEELSREIAAILKDGCITGEGQYKMVGELFGLLSEEVLSWWW